MSNVCTIVAPCTVTGFGIAGRDRTKLVAQLLFANGEVSACLAQDIAMSALMRLASTRRPRDFAFDVPAEGPVRMRFQTKREARLARASDSHVTRILEDRNPSSRPVNAPLHAIAPAFA